MKDMILRDVVFEKQIGFGAHQVWRARYQGSIVAARVFDTGKHHGMWPPDSGLWEMQMLRRAQSEFAVKFIGFAQTIKGPTLLMEMCASTLRDIAKQTGGLDASTFLQYLEHVCQGLEWMHQQHIVLGNLEANNLLLRNGTPVFANFSDAHVIDNSAPSAIRYGDASDIWMVATVAFELWTGQQPTQSPCTLPQDMPLRDLLQACFNDMDSNRPTASLLRAQAKVARSLLGADQISHRYIRWEDTGYEDQEWVDINGSDLELHTVGVIDEIADQMDKEQQQEPSDEPPDEVDFEWFNQASAQNGDESDVGWYSRVIDEIADQMDKEQQQEPSDEPPDEVDFEWFNQASAQNVDGSDGMDWYSGVIDEITDDNDLDWYNKSLGGTRRRSNDFTDSNESHSKRQRIMCV